MSKRGRPLKWKRCPACWRKKLVAEDFYHWTEKGGERVARLCKVCTRRRARERYAATIADPYTRKLLHARQNGWSQRESMREHNAERCRRYREKLKAERPEVYRQQLEDARIRNRLRNERLGKPVAPKTATVVEPFVAPLPVAPLVDFLNRAQLDGEHVAKDMAREAYRALHENRDYVTVNVADRLITAYGGVLSAVYPELFA